MSMLSRFATLVPAPLSYVGSTTAAITGSTATTTNISLTGLTGGIGSAPIAGDLVVVYYGVGSTADRNLSVTTSGYTEVADIYANDNFDANLSVSYKTMTATPDTSVDVSATGATNDAGAVAIHVWRGVDNVVVFDTAAITATGTNSVLCNPGAITPVTAGTVILAGGAGAHNAGVQTFTSSNLSNFVTLGGPNSTNDVTIGLGSTTWTTGAFDPAAFGFSTSDNVAFSWAAVTLALLPQQSQVGPFAIASSFAQAASVSSVSVNKPTGTRDGDFLVAFANADGGTSSWNAPSGWSLRADQFSGGGAVPNTALLTKDAASEPASWAFTFNTTATLSVTVVTYRNAAHGDTGNITTAASPLNVAAAVSDVPYSRVLGMAARGAASITITPPATMQVVQRDNDATSPSRVVAQDIALTPAGTTGTRSFGVGSATNVSGVLESIKPATSYTKYANYITSNSASATATTTVTVTTPTSVPGNLLLFAVTASDNTTPANTVTFATPSGWTLLSGNSTEGINYQPNQYIFYRTVDGSETTSYTATASVSVDNLIGTIITLAGADVTTLTAGTTNTGSSTTAVAANAVTATANGILLYFGSQSNNSAAVTFTPPTSMTEITDVSATRGTNNLTFEVAYQEGLSAGSTGTKTATASSSAGTNRFRAILVTVSGK